MWRWCILVLALGLAACGERELVCPTTSSLKSGEVATSSPGAARFVAFGDYGDGSGDEADVSELVRCLDPDFVVTTGDNNYDEGAAETIDENIGQFYHQLIGGYRGGYGQGSPTNRFWPAPGNHDWTPGDLGPYTDYFELPGNERYYDVDLGIVHLFVLDSDGHEPDGTTAESAQGRWLEERLASSAACLDVVVMHHPPYSSGAHGSSPGMRWPFAAWGADVVLSGHDHDYERAEADGIPYFVTGLGGEGRRAFETAIPESRVRYDDDYGALLVEVDAAGATYRFFDASGAEIDALHVDRACP